MPVILEDEIFSPPFMRRPKRYYQAYDDGCVECMEVSVLDSPTTSGTTTTTTMIEALTPPRSPIVIHEDHYVPLPEYSRGHEYVIQPAGERYRGGAELEFDYPHRRGRRGSNHYNRARSVGHVSDYGYYSDDYYVVDGSRHGGVRGSHGHRGRHLLEGASSLTGHNKYKDHRRSLSHDGHHSHKAKKIAEAGAAALAARQYMKHSRGRSTSSNRRNRHLAEVGAGVAAIGLDHILNRSRSRSHSRLRRHHRRFSHEGGPHFGAYGDDKSHRRIKHIAEAGLGLATAGAAKEFYDHRKHRRSSSASPGRGGHHNGQHLAAAALGATAAKLAYNKYAQRRRSSSVCSCCSDSSDGRDHHRGRNLAAGAALGATAAGLAAKAVHGRHRHRSRSSSASSSSSSSSSPSSSGGRRRRRHGHGHHHRLSKTALGTTAAAGLSGRRRSRSRSGSRERRNHRGGLNKIAYTMGGALAPRNVHDQHHHHHRRSLSADRGGPGHGFVEDGSIHSSPTRTTGGGGFAREAARGVGEAIAYKIGDTVVGGVAGERKGAHGHGHGHGHGHVHRR